MPPRPFRSSELVTSVARSPRVVFAQVDVMLVPETTGFPAGSWYVPEELREAIAVPTKLPRTMPIRMRARADRDLRMEEKRQSRHGHRTV
jgi:hypothetical protein